METQPVDENTELMLDGNALAGILHEIFDVEMTVASVECAFCGQEGEVGSLWAFVETPGLVLRCPACHNIVLRLVVAPDRIYLDARGAQFFCVPRGTLPFPH